ncbi:hypothetical protein N7520_003684 [Penicillium odoratum]|uniref:uncharacterized protein n=1 Tax=Penicillium odoratum TaxID=1167516 RepID=UPI002548F1BD|nr:uncharacterized protein N7520_003684 [Penicillium odoratum]KAJ5769125.1 hypothetical protein N7520_003684 [Penicillium odoratum]
MGFARDLNRMSISISALMFAICYAAVVTMSAEECLGEFDESKDKVLQRYRNGVQTYLTKADFRQSSDLIVLQAFMIYLICGRFDHNGPDVKNLIPVAISIAKKNGLHEENPGLTLFDIEMRRRIWWHVYILDIRTAEDFGVDPHIQEPSDHFKLPLNINDSNLHPDMTQTPQIDNGKTEMMFSLVRFKISNFARQIVFSKDFCQQNGHGVLSPLEKCKAIDNFKDAIGREHLSYCDSSIPLDHITEISSRLILAKLKLAVTKPRDRLNQHILSQACFRNTCVDILKRARFLSIYEKGKQWLWLFQTYLEWDALIYLLINLSLVPIGDGVFSAWKVAEDAYYYWKNKRYVHFDGRWKQVEEFRSQALIARDMFQRAPSLSVQVSCHGENHEPFPSQEHDPSLQAEATDFQRDISSASVFSDATPALPEPNPALDIPTSGTGCQWSASIFERYFELLDAEQSQVAPWI